MMSDTETNITIPYKIIPLFLPARGELRNRVMHGGRGSGKSRTLAIMSAVWGLHEPLRILCTREYQISIRESMFAEIKDVINTYPVLTRHYIVGVDQIKGKNGTLFLFKGLKNNITAIKSMSQIDLCIIEEANDISKASLQELIPTIRAPKSEFWISYNPRKKSDPIDRMFRGEKVPPRSHVIEVNYNDNPFFPPVLNEQRKHDLDIMDYALYKHVWLGDYYQLSDSQVFGNKWKVAEFKPAPDWDGAYFGLDFGFSQDPTAAIKCWIDSKENTLYIEYDCAKIGLELDDTTEYVKRCIPSIEKYIIRADCVRPESINYLSRHGLPRIIACEKGKGSVEDGIEFIKSHKKIIIHPRCRETIKEFELYSYKVDRLTGDILPDLVDKYNHVCDSLRYALFPAMQMRKRSYDKML